MHKCPFHSESTGIEAEGEINTIKCPACGEYRISNVALEQISRHETPPSGWLEIVARGRLISTRDTRLLNA